MPPRILFVTTSTTRGGAEKILYHLAKSLDPNKFAVSGVLSLKPLGAYGDLLRQNGIPVKSLELGKNSLWKAFLALRREIESERPDIIQAFMYQAVQLCRLVKILSPGSFKLAVSHRVNPRTRSPWTLWVDRRLKNQDDRVIAECEASRSFLIERQGYPAQKVKTIRNGVSEMAPRQDLKSDIYEKRRSLNVLPGGILIGTVGRLDRQKNHVSLVQAIGALNKRMDIRCVIIGEGPERPNIEREISRWGLQEKIFLLGEKTDVPSWLLSLDAFILPSLWEGLPSVILEAMSLGLPVIASDVDGVPEIIDDGSNGFLVKPAAPEALAQKIIELFEAPASKREEIGRRARETVAERFTLPRMLGDYESSYLELLK